MFLPAGRECSGLRLERETSSLQDWYSSRRRAADVEGEFDGVPAVGSFCDIALPTRGRIQRDSDETGT